MQNTTARTLLIGSNNAHNWYAVIDSDGSLIDAAPESSDVSINELLAIVAEHGLDNWEGGWSDAAEPEAYGDWLDADNRIVEGEAAVLDTWGGTVDAHITSGEDADAFFSGQESEFGDVKHGDITVRLSQQAYLDGTKEHPIYRAHGSDWRGNDYKITWQPYANLDEIDDDANACDWAKYTVEEV